jgi:Uma2 family endonuclease
MDFVAGLDQERPAKKECPMSTALIDEIATGKATGIVTLNAGQYHEMIRTGIIPDGATNELLDGILVWKDRGREGDKPLSHDPRHALLVTRLIHILHQWVSSQGYHVRSQLPISLSEYNEPEPDVAVIRGSAEEFAERHPGPRDVAAIIEIADSSLQRDRSTKQRLYAGAGIPLYWIVNSRNRQVEVYQQPDAAREVYARSSVHWPGDSISLPVGTSELPIDLAQLLA